ncbi:MAG: DUF4231 domain-containing protein [Methylophilaceae bacterium]
MRVIPKLGGELANSNSETLYPPFDIPTWTASSPAWHRLEQQLEWYDKKSGYCQKLYKVLKLIQISLAVLIPILSNLETEIAKWSTAVAGASIAILEGIQHMNQYSVLWVMYRATAERLKHEKYLFLSSAGPYKNQSQDERLVTLAERVEEHVSTEHANWFNETKRNATQGRTK